MKKLMFIAFENENLLIQLAVHSIKQYFDKQYYFYIETYVHKANKDCIANYECL